jgi:hypothetical protein
MAAPLVIGGTRWANATAPLNERENSFLARAANAFRLARRLFFLPPAHTRAKMRTAPRLPTAMDKMGQEYRADAMGAKIPR